MSPFDEVIESDVETAISEDVGSGDVSSLLINKNEFVKAVIIAREPMVLCGIPWVNETFLKIDPEVEITWFFNDGSKTDTNTIICRIKGLARSILSAERIGLNFLQTLSATASVSSKFVEALGDKKTTILDTRKTIPGLRRAQKYATKIGGVKNHRMGLYDAYLIKENHIKACGSVTQAVRRARELDPEKLVEVEVENLVELKEALQAGSDQILLDNFSVTDIKKAVTINKGTAELEVSGDINMKNIHKYANLGVDYISVGALTKNVQAIDLSLRFE